MRSTDVMLDRMISELGSERLLDELTRAMDTDELKSDLKYVARMYDIDLTKNEEGEE